MINIVNNTSSDMATPLTKRLLGREICHSIHSPHSDLTVKLTSVIMVLGKGVDCKEAVRGKPLQLLNNVVVGTGQSNA